MFERYTEKARRVIFFARYEASQFGSPYIETEHLLLGLLREDKALANRFLRSHAAVESIRKQIEGHTTIREKVSTSVDLPLSHECKSVLAYGAEEAERLNHKHIGTEHLLLGLLREEKCFAAEILHERGLRLSTIREELARSQSEEDASARPKESSLLAEFSRDLTQAAMDNTLDPLIGRDYELERVVQILCRRTKNNPVLIGEPGVGKTAIVEGVGAAQSRGRRAVVPGGQTHPGARSFVDRRRYQVPRPVRRAAQDNHEGIDGEPERHHLHRRAAHSCGRRIGRRVARRRKHPEAGTVARRDPVHRRNHSFRIPQIHREGPVPRTPLPGSQGSAAERIRCRQDPVRHQGSLREVPRGGLYG